jgi:6,7-dimethyl-8-ribityllumazine synthase
MSNYKILEKNYSKIDKNSKIIFISAEFNRNFTEEMEKINEEILQKRWFNNIEKFLVPWAFEIPWFLKKIKEEINPDLVICFWVIVRGETTHYDMVAWESARGIMTLSLEHGKMVIINAILTCENNDQVMARVKESSTYSISWLNLLWEIKKIYSTKK